MGYIGLFDLLYTPTTGVKQPKVITPPEVIFHGKPLLEDAKEITLAEYTPETSNVITAHRMKDYRRKQFNLVLLPKLDILFNKILEGSEFWGELLRNESPYD